MEKYKVKNRKNNFKCWQQFCCWQIFFASWNICASSNFLASRNFCASSKFCAISKVCASRNFCASSKVLLAGIFVPAAKFCASRNFWVSSKFCAGSNFCACRNICFLFVLLLYVPNQQLWSWRDGQLTLPHLSWASLKKRLTSTSSSERSDSVVECLTRYRVAAASSLTGVIALCP